MQTFFRLITQSLEKKDCVTNAKSVYVCTHEGGYLIIGGYFSNSHFHMFRVIVLDQVLFEYCKILFQPPSFNIFIVKTHCWDQTYEELYYGDG